MYKQIKEQENPDKKSKNKKIQTKKSRRMCGYSLYYISLQV